jgi:hypothetical protein
MVSSTATTKDEVVLQVDSTVQAFLDQLGLPLVHPSKNNNNYTASAATDDGEDFFVVPTHLRDVGEGVFELPSTAAAASTIADGHQQHLPTPYIGPMSPLELHDNSHYELLLTLTKIGAPLIAMGELWLRLFAFYICPLCLCFMIYRDVQRSMFCGGGNNNNSNRQQNHTTASKSKEDSMKINNIDICISIIGLASSAVLFTDSLYVYEFGRIFGFSFWCLSIVLAIRVALALSLQQRVHDSVMKTKSNKTKSRISSNVMCKVSVPSKSFFFQTSIFICLFTTVVVFLQSGGHVGNVHSTSVLHQMPHPGIDLPTIEPGLYYSKSNMLMSSIASNLKESAYTYDVQHGATPYLFTGDQRTGIPFLVNAVEDQQYIRVYVTNPFDREHIALDIAFPYDAFNYGAKKMKLVHDSTKPVYLVLHGLNGGSHEEYVKELVKRRRAEGSTVVVMIARGMVDTSMTGWNVFHGARTVS